MDNDKVNDSGVSGKRQVPGAIYEAVYNIDGSTLQFSISDGIEALTGYSPELFVSDRDLFTSLIHVADSESYRLEAERCNTEGDRFSWEGRVRRKQGDLLWVQMLSYQTKLLNDTVKWNGVLMDVTERKANEQELLKFKEINTLLIDKGPCVLFIRESIPPFKILYHSESAKNLFLQPKGRTIVGTPGDTSIIHPDDIDMLNESFIETVEKGESRIEFRVGDSVQGYKWLLSHKKLAEHDPNMMLGVVIDVTEHYDSARAFKRMQSKFQAMLDLSPVGGGMFDIHSNLVYINQNFLEMLGRPREEVLGSEWLSCVHRDDRKRVERLIILQSEYEKPKTFMTRFTHNKREMVWCQVALAPIIVDGQFEGTVASFIDVTNQRETELLADQAIYTAEDATKVKSALISDVFSGLGDPIRRLVAKARELASIERQDSGSEANQDLLDICEDTLSRFHDLYILTIDNLGDLPLRKTSVSVQFLLDRVIEKSAPKIKALALDLSARIATTSDVLVCCDTERTLQMLNSIIGVAIETSQVEGIIGIDCSIVSNELVKIMISNTVRPDELVWYEAVDRKRLTNESAVLQLVVARRICQAMGGELSIDSVKSVVTVTITLPRKTYQFELEKSVSVGELRD